MKNTSTFASQKAYIPTQTSLDNRIPCYQRFQWLNTDTVVNLLNKFTKPNKCGRKGYDKVWMLQWLIYKQFTRCTYRDLESMTGIDYSTFIKFRKRLMLKHWFEKVFKKLIERIIEKQDTLVAIIDSSFVESFSKGRGKEDGQEYSGHKEKTGYKLHQIIDFETRLPLKLKTTGGARADIVLGRNLVRGAPKYWKKKIKAFLADRGYDAEDFILQIKKKWKSCDVGIPFRVMNQQILTEEAYHQTKSLNRCLNQSFLNKRTEIERYFSRKKHVFHLGEEKTRHLENFNANCHFTAIMEILEWLSKNPGWRVLFTRLIVLTGGKI